MKESLIIENLMIHRFSSKESLQRTKGEILSDSNSLGPNLSTSSLLNSISFPEVNFSDEQSSLDDENEDCDDVEMIKTKNLEILHAFKIGVKKLKQKSQEMVSSFTEKKQEKYEETCNKSLTSNSPSPESPSNLLQLQSFLEKIRALNEIRVQSLSLITKEQNLISEVSQENHLLQENIIQIASDICNNSLDTSSPSCRCLLF